MYIPTNFKAVYSHEDQGPGKDGKLGLGICKHLSVSIELIDKIPSPIAVDMIAEMFYFNPIYKCIIWPEGFGDGTQIAMNIVEPMNWTPELDGLRKEIELAGRKLLTEEGVNVINQTRKIPRPETKGI